MRGATGGARAARPNVARRHASRFQLSYAVGTPQGPQHPQQDQRSSSHNRGLQPQKMLVVILNHQHTTRTCACSLAAPLSETASASLVSKMKPDGVALRRVGEVIRFR